MTGVSSVKSGFDMWLEKASVRRSDLPYKPISKADLAASPVIKTYPHLDRFLQLRPEVGKQALSVQQALLNLSFFQFTKTLETEFIVEPIVRLVLSEEGRFPSLKPLLHDIRLAIIDEIFHADMAARIIAEIQSLFRSQLPENLYFSSNLENVRTILNGLEPGRTRSLGELFFVVLSETLITANLAAIDQLAVDASSPIALANAHHASDEYRHHKLFTRLWSGLLESEIDEQAFDALSAIQGDLIRAYVTPDCDLVASQLIHEGFDEKEVHRIISLVYNDKFIEERIDSWARHSRKLLGD